MKRLPLLFALVALPFLVPALAETMNPPAPAVSGAAGSPATPAPEDKTPNFIEPAFLQADNLKKFLGDFPKSGSAKEKKDIETLLKLQASRTPEEIARAQAEIDYDP
ncbi:MAG TPA: hypothetical protein VIM58_03770, partial [Candidatus Methylacidiphilales bacterium]